MRDDWNGSLLQMLHEAQQEQGYLDEAAIGRIAAQFSMEPGEVYETASFYSMFRFFPAGKTIIQICRNAPCHVAGAAQTIEALEESLGIQMGETTPDGRISLEYTECLGQCQAAPAVLVNGILHTRVTADQIPGLLRTLTIGG